MEEQEIFKGGTLIVNLDSIEMIGNDYVYAENDKIRIALKKKNYKDEIVLYAEIKPTAGETSMQHVFTAEETQEKLEIDESYILQGDLINSQGTFPMLLQYLKVIGQAIIPPKESE